MTDSSRLIFFREGEEEEREEEGEEEGEGEGEEGGGEGNATVYSFTLKIAGSSHVGICPPPNTMQNRWHSSEGMSPVSHNVLYIIVSYIS
ncbi:MAG: hypothetical protein SPJ79_03370 [Prevotella sp.]|nr:hypothetical protein [Bacteroidales bacterium]MDY3354935.1 hypothetical protein [Prevotella sp.]MDY5876612.1 hypothetical protein [Prevotella sp.]